MKKSLISILSLFLILFSFSCSFLTNNSGSFSINLPSQNISRANTESIDPELPQVYTVRILTQSGKTIREITGNAGSPILIENLRPGKILVSVEGRGPHFGYAGQDYAEIKTGETTSKVIKLDRNLLPVYVSSINGSNIVKGTAPEYGDGSEAHPFATLDMAVFQIADYGKKINPDNPQGVIFLQGSFNEKIDTQGCNITFYKNPKATEAKITIPKDGVSGQIFNSNTVEFLDITFENSNITVDGGCTFKIGGGTKFTGTSVITLQDSDVDNAVITISQPLTSEKVADLTFTGTQTSEATIIKGINSNIKLENEYSKFNIISNEAKFEYKINNSGKLIVIEYKGIDEAVTQITSSGSNNLDLNVLITDQDASPTEMGRLATAIIGKAGGTVSLNLKAPNLTEIPENWLKNNDLGTARLKSIILPNNIKTIGGHAFYKCTSLESINLDDITFLGDSAFEGCTKLKTIGTFNTGLTNILIFAFKNCTSLTGTINIPGTVARITEGAFQGCTGITNVIVNKGTVQLFSNIFMDCKNLQSISLPIGLSSISSGCFDNCTNLKELVIPDTVTDFLAVDKYDGSGNLTSGLSTSGVTTLTIPCNLAFGSSTSDTVSNSKITNLKIIPSTESTTITEYAYQKFTALKTVEMSGITKIGDYAFNGCTSLKTANIPASVTTIGSGAFRKCDALESVTFDDSGSSWDLQGSNPIATTVESPTENAKSLRETHVSDTWNKVKN